MTASLPDVYSMPLDAIDVSDPKIYQDDVWQPISSACAERPRCITAGKAGTAPIWSVCKYNDIMQVEINHGVYSSELGGIAVEDLPRVGAAELHPHGPAEHDEQRKVVGPIVAPANLAEMEATIRERTIRVLDRLPRKPSTGSSGCQSN